LNSNEIAGRPPCEFTVELAGIFDRGDTDAARQLAPHVQTCPHCRAEFERLAKRPGLVRRLLSDFLMGLGVIGWVGLFFSARGITDAINRQLDQSGHFDGKKKE
jgi:hypothetical protein